MLSCLCEYKALVNAYKCEITEKSHFLVVNGYVLVNHLHLIGTYKYEIIEKSHFLFVNGYKKIYE